MSVIATKSAAQRGAEAAVEGFRRELGPFVVAAETTRMAMIFTDAKQADNRIIFANDSFLALTGYDRDEVLGQGFAFLLADGPRAAAPPEVKAAFGDGADTGGEICCRRKSGGLFWTLLFVSPVRDEAGEVVQHFVSFADVTRHRQEAEHLRFLLDELNHRTQNTLATVQAIAVQTLRGHADPAVVETFEGRILALSKAHGLLGRENWDAVTLRDVLDQILAPFGLGDPEAARFSIEGPEVRLSPKIALTLAMVFHELATNAAKHGALSGSAAGRIDIAWRIDPDPLSGRLRLSWRESGGPSVRPPARRGFGSRLIESGLAQELDGEVRLDYPPTGVVCRIVMPTPRSRRDD